MNLIRAVPQGAASLSLAVLKSDGRRREVAVDRAGNWNGKRAELTSQRPAYGLCQRDRLEGRWAADAKDRRGAAPGKANTRWPRPKPTHARAAGTHHRLCRPRPRPGDFLRRLVFFPAAHFFSGDEVSVITEIVRAARSERRFENLLPYPPLSRCDWRAAVSAFLRARDEH